MEAGCGPSPCAQCLPDLQGMDDGPMAGKFAATLCHASPVRGIWLGLCSAEAASAHLPEPRAPRHLVVLWTEVRGYFQQPVLHPGGEPRAGDGSPATGHSSCKVSRIGAAWGRDGGTGQGWAREPWTTGGTGSALGLLSGLGCQLSSGPTSPALTSGDGPARACLQGGHDAGPVGARAPGGQSCTV